MLKSSVRQPVTLRQMTARSHDASADAVGLGALLVLLHGADAPVDTVEVTYRLWRHRQRAHAAFVAESQEQSVGVHRSRRTGSARRSLSRPSTRRRCGSGVLVSEFVLSITAASGTALRRHRRAALVDLGRANGRQEQPGRSQRGKQLRERAPDHAQPHPAAQFSALLPDGELPRRRQSQPDRTRFQLSACISTAPRLVALRAARTTKSPRSCLAAVVSPFLDPGCGLNSVTVSARARSSASSVHRISPHALSDGAVPRSVFSASGASRKSTRSTSKWGAKVSQAHTVRRLDRPDEAIEPIDSGTLTKGHGKALLTESDHYRRRTLARRAAAESVGSHARNRDCASDQVPTQTSRSQRRARRCRCEMEDALSNVTGREIGARSHRDGYQLLLGKQAGDRLVELLAPNPIEL